MFSYGLKCSKNAEGKNLGVPKTKKVKPMLLSRCEVWVSKKLRFIKDQEASGILSS